MTAPRPVQPPGPQNEPSRARIDAPKVLLATTGKLPSTARLAMELHDAGAIVSLLAPGSHPAATLDLLRDKVTHSALSPLAALEAALLRLAPDLVVPCDEPTVRDLHAVHRITRHGQIRTLIERSAGPPSNYPIIVSRIRLLALAERLGVRVPASTPIPNAAALTAWISRSSAPFVLKADGSWSGFGVRIVSDKRIALNVFHRMTRPVSAYLALREMLLEGNRFGLRAWLRRERPTISLQAYIDGWPANVGVACWNGEVLAAACAEAVATRSATGPSTVARIIHNDAMVDAAQRLVRALGLSGLIGFDFMIEAATGHAYLIEMNPRNTPICALRLGPGRDLTAQLVARLAQRPVRERPARVDRDIVVYFPDTWRLDPYNRFLHSGYHDVPWEQPALVRRLVKPELRYRYWILRLLSRHWNRFRDRNLPLS